MSYTVGYTKMDMLIADGDVWFNASDVISVLDNWSKVNPDDGVIISLKREFIKLKNKHKRKKHKK